MNKDKEINNEKSLSSSIATIQKVFLVISVLLVVVIVFTGNSLVAWAAWGLTSGLFLLGIILQLVVHKMDKAKTKTKATVASENSDVEAKSILLSISNF